MPLKPCKKTETQPACDLSHAIQLASLIDTCVLDHGEKTKCTGSDTICSHLPHLAKDFFFFLQPSSLFWSFLLPKVNVHITHKIIIQYYLHGSHGKYSGARNKQ